MRGESSFFPPAAMTGERFDWGGKIGVAGRPLAVEDHQRRERQRGSNGAAATERRGLHEARDDWRVLRSQFAVSHPFTEEVCAGPSPGENIDFIMSNDLLKWLLVSQ